MDLNGTPQSQAAFIQWVKRKYPRYYAQAMAEGNSNIGDFASGLKSIFDTIKGAVLTLGPAYIQTKSEIELLKLNIARAKAGQAPVNSLPAADSGGGGAVATNGGSGLPSWAIPAAIGAVLLIFLMRR